MRILYLSLSYVPSRRASSVHVMKMCSALARRGHQVTLVTKRCGPRQEPGVSDDFAFYGVEPAFRLAKLPRPAWRGGGLVWLTAVRSHLRRHHRTIDLVFARDLAGGWLAARLGLPVLFETHGPPAGGLGRALFRRLVASGRLVRLVAISDALGQRLRADGLLAGDPPLVVAHDAADPGPPPGGLRGELPPGGQPRGGPPGEEPAAGDGAMRVGYVGHLYAGRGVELIVELARRLPAAEFHLFGGTESDLARWRRGALPANVRLHGFVEPARLPAIYAGLDVLLMPYQPRTLTATGLTDTASWMSPMKMFEYMAAGRPIVASDLPVLREVLRDGGNALLAAPGDPEAWRLALARLFDDPELRRRLGAAARTDLLREHTWDARASKLLAGL